jgi:hypothetical protein
MSVTATQVGALPYQIVGNQKMVTRDIAMDSSYLLGGEPLSANTLGLNKVDRAICTIQKAATTTVNATAAGYDEATSLLHVYDETPAEVASEANLTGLVVRVVAYGT